MAKCPNLTDPDVNNQFNEMVELFGETNSYYLWHLNNGNPLTLDSKGNPSKHYQKYLKDTGSHEQALQAFANNILKARDKQINEKQATEIAKTESKYSPSSNMSEEELEQAYIGGNQDISDTSSDDYVPTFDTDYYESLKSAPDIDYGSMVSDQINDFVESLDNMSIEELNKLSDNDRNSKQLEDDVPHIDSIVPIYTGVFFDQNSLKKKFLPKHSNVFAHHSTIAFKPESISSLPIGSKKSIKVVGRLTTDKVDVLIVENDLSSNEFPHITLSTAKGVAPFASNQEIKNNQNKIVKMDATIEGIVGVNDGTKTITKVIKGDTLDTDFTSNQAAKLTDKADLTGESNNLYSNKQLSLSKYESLPYTEHNGTTKIFSTLTYSSAKLLAEDTGGYLYTTKNRDNSLLYKVAIKRPVGEISHDLVADISDPVTSKEVATIVLRKKHRLTALQKKLANKSPRSKEIKASIAILKSDLEKLEEKYTNPKDLINVAKDDVRRVYNSLKSVKDYIQSTELKESDLIETMDKLIDISYSIKGWLNIAEIIREDFYDNRTEIMSIQGGISESNEIYNELISDIYLRYANIRSSRTGLKIEDVLGAVEDIDKASSNYLSIGESGIPLLETADDFMRNMADKVNSEVIKKQSILSRIKEKAKKSLGKTEEQISDMLLQKDSKGGWTGNYVGRFLASLYEEKSNRAEEAKKKRKNGDLKAWGNYYKWLEKNTRELTEDQLATIADNSIEEIESLSEEAFVEKFGDYPKKAILKQKEFLKEYKLDRGAFAEELFSGEEFGDGTLTINEEGDIEYENDDAQKKDNFDREITSWNWENNPVEFVKQAQNNRKDRNGYKYLVSAIPTKNWRDPAYDRIKNNAPLNEVYEHMVNTFEENNQFLPYFNGLSTNYIPEMAISFMDRMLKSSGLNKAYSYVNNKLRTAITDEAVSSKDGRIIIGNREIKPIPVGMMENKINPEYKERNIFTVLEKHTNMALNYKYKSEIEPMVTASMDLMETVNEVTSYVKDGKKEYRSKFNETSFLEKRLINAKSALKYAIDAKLYNKTQEVEGMSKKTIEVTDESGNVQKRSFSFSKFVDTLNGFSYIKQLGLPNAISPTVNAAFGFASNMAYAAGGVDVSESNMLKAQGRMMAITIEGIGKTVSPKNAKKVYAFMKRLSVIGDIHDVSTAKKGIVEWMTILQSKAEFLNQGALMWALLESTEMKDKNGKKVNAFDAFIEKDGELVWNETLMGPQEEVASSRVLSENKNQVNIASLTAHMDAVNRTVHGDYKNTMKIKESAAMRAVMLYKRWIPQAVVSRFGRAKENKDLMAPDGSRGRAVKGRYITYFDATDIDGLEVKKREIFKILAGALVNKRLVKSGLSQLSEVDRQNLMRNVRELHFIGTLTGAMAILQAMFGDDDKAWALKMAINTLSKTQSDLLFFMSPNSAKQILDNVVPAMSIISDAIAITTATYKTATGDPYYQSGPWKDHSRVKVATYRAFPVTSGGVKMYNYGSRVFNYN